MKWKQLTGVLCDKKGNMKLKDKVYKTAITEEKKGAAYGRKEGGGLGGDG